ncbi:VOC family protein [Streptomyces sp. NPDC057474]|uniref:VOC family protein n=1 Tax=Streptomyces sp. NPDC057474 TaxID=3346144 RepID=UPI003686256E
MSLRAFPLVHTAQVAALTEFYERLGFVRRLQHPEDGPSFVALQRGMAEIAISSEPALSEGGAASGPGQWRMCVFVDAVDAMVDRLSAAGVQVLQEPADMPWGERLAVVADPDGNHVAVVSMPRN